MTVTTDQTEMSDCDQTTGWTGTITLDTEVFIEGNGSLSAKVSKTTYTAMYALAGNTDFSDTVIYTWVLGSSAAQFDTKANGGIRLRVEMNGLTTNFVEWYVAGSDSGYSGGWQMMSVRTTMTYQNSGGTINLALVSSVGIIFKVLASAAKINCWWDRTAYGSSVNIYAGTSGTPTTFADIAAADLTGGWGQFIEIAAGIYKATCKINIGSTVAAQNTYFKDTNSIITFNPDNFGTDYWEVKGQGNATGDTRIFFGTKSGGRGLSGVTFLSTGISKTKLIMSDTNIDYLGIYGSKFLSFATSVLPNSSTNREALSTTWEASGEVTVDLCKVQYSNFINAAGHALKLSSISHNVSDVNFINCVYAIHITVAGTYPLNNFVISGGDGITYFDVDNSIEATVYDSTLVGGSNQKVGNATTIAAGQSFTGTGGTLSRAIIRLREIGSATGNAVAKIYASTGSDPNRVPTGSVLATSNLVDVSGIGASYVDVDFEFEDEFSLVNGTTYFLIIEYTGDVSNHLEWEYDNANGDVSNNFATYVSSWTAQTGSDGRYSVNIGAIIKITATGSSNPSYNFFSATLDGAIIIIASKQFTLTDLITGTEIRAYTGSITDPANAVEIGGIESSGTSFNFGHQSGGASGYINIHKVDYVSITLVLVYANSDQSIPIQQQFDRGYDNP